MNTELSKELQELLDSKGNTPIAESETYAVMTKKNNVLITEIFKVAIKGSEVKIEDYVNKPMELATFINKLSVKISKLTDADGNYKKTPNTENIGLPNVYQLEELEPLVLQKIGGDSSEKLQKEMDDICLAIMEKDFKVDIGSLTDWEKTLMTDQYQMYAVNFRKTYLGKQ